MPNPYTEHPDPRDASRAGWEAARGGVIGAARWGIVGLALAGLGCLYSPLYRSFTMQFKVYLQMCPMVFGGYLEADSRVRAFEEQMKARRRRILAQERRRRREEEWDD